MVASAGRALARAAKQDHRVAYAAVNDAVVCFHGELHRARGDQPIASARPQRTSWTRSAMLRLFALGPAKPMSQSAIARRLGLSHVAVGKQLPLPAELAVRTPEGWRVVDRAACWDQFMKDYVGPRGLTTYWAATEDLAEQLRRIERVMRERNNVAPVVSGDFAADFYAPWRRPSHIVAYVANQPPMEDHGFVTVRSADATVELCTPRDPTVLAMSREWPTAQGVYPRRYADPLITAWDMRRSPGGDIDSAVNELRARSLETPLWT